MSAAPESSTEAIEPQARVDARGLACPHPVLELRAALREVQPGQRVELLATDPLASIDVRAFCLRARHPLLNEDRDGEVLRFLIERGPES